MTTDLPIEVSRISTSWVEVEQVKETLILQGQRQEIVSMFLKTLSKVIYLTRRILMKTRQNCQGINLYLEEKEIEVFWD